MGGEEAQERLNHAALPMPWSGGCSNFKSENVASAHVWFCPCLISEGELLPPQLPTPPSDLRLGIWTRRAGLHLIFVNDDPRDGVLQELDKHELMPIK